MISEGSGIQADSMAMSNPIPRYPDPEIKDMISPPTILIAVEIMDERKPAQLQDQMQIDCRKRLQKSPGSKKLRFL